MNKSYSFAHPVSLGLCANKPIGRHIYIRMAVRFSIVVIYIRWL